MGKNKFEIKPLKNIEEKKEQLPGLPFLTGEAPLPNKTKPKNAIDLFLDNKYLDIQYNKRRNELIEQDENPTAKLQEIQKLENTAKSESPDIQSKIKEQLLNNDFQSQYIMRSAEPDVQKKRVYRGPQVGFTDEEVEVPRFQEISDEQLEYYEKNYDRINKLNRGLSRRAAFDEAANFAFSEPIRQKFLRDAVTFKQKQLLVAEKIKQGMPNAIQNRLLAADAGFATQAGAVAGQQDAATRFAGLGMQRAFGQPSFRVS